MLRRETMGAAGFIHPSLAHRIIREMDGGADPGRSERNAARWGAVLLLGFATAGGILASGPSDTRAPGAPTAPSQRSILASSASSNVPMAAPVLGFVWDSATTSLRRVEGIPGAALAGTSFFRAGFTGAAVAPNQGFALLTDANGGLYFSVLPSFKPPAMIASGMPADVRIAFSPSSDWAVLYSPSGTTTFLAAGLNETPAVREVGSLAGISGIISAIASDSGAILLARAGSSGVSISSTTAASALTPVTSIGQLGGMSFLAGTDTAVISDSQNNNLWKVTGIEAAASVSLIAGAPEGVSQPGALAISRDNRAVWVISAANTALQEFVLTGSSTGPAKVLAAPFAISGLERLNGNSVFRLKGAATGVLFVLDGDWPSGRIVQVPVTHLPPMLGGIQ